MEAHKIIRTKPTPAAIYVSAFVLPGLGQFMQRRWFIGTLYAAVFLVCVGALAAKAVLGLVAYYSWISDFNGKGSEVPNISWRQLLALLGVTLLVWLIGLFDVILAYRRQYRQWQDFRVEELMRGNK